MFGRDGHLALGTGILPIGVEITSLPSVSPGGAQ